MCEDVESDNQEIIRNLESELASVGAQLSLSKEECECLKVDTTAQLRYIDQELKQRARYIELDHLFVFLVCLLFVCLFVCLFVVLSNLTAEVTSHCLKVQQLEAYLGGEIPDLQEHRWGGTWKEEREILCSEIQVRPPGHNTGLT